ncbi:MAG: hypothetical protein Q7T80_16930 [Methanoregula sp.]|nr:hypothetical protein [Methanoregula sp.]
MSSCQSEYREGSPPWPPRESEKNSPSISKSWLDICLVMVTQSCPGIPGLIIA